MVSHTKNKIEYLTFSHFDKALWLRHCFSTRIGGISTGCAESMNLTFRKEDAPENVRENYRRMCGAVGFSYDGITFSNQVHEVNIKKVEKQDRGNGFHRENAFPSADGIMTNVPGIVLTTFYADCVPLFFLDEENKAIALAHAGWRGTVGEIGRKTLEAMERAYGTKPSAVLAGIGPSIGPCCFEVDEPVVDIFLEKLPFSENMIDACEKTPGKFYIDLWRINREILLNGGIPQSQIEMAGICTKCHPETFFSHRITGFQRGSMAAMMEIATESER